MSYAIARRRGGKNDLNKLQAEDRSVHDWYRFVLSFPPHLVRTYLERFNLQPGSRVLDPFCGTGTTIVECQKLGYAGVGIEATPMAHFASSVKVDWTPEPRGLIEHAKAVAEMAHTALHEPGTCGAFQHRLLEASPAGPTRQSLPPDKLKLLLTNSISPLPLHKTLVLIDCLNRIRDERYHRHEMLALAKALTTSIGNLHFGPEVGVGPPKVDAPVTASWLENVYSIADDLSAIGSKPTSSATVIRGDSRQINRLVEPKSIDAVITSPPYPNEKDYTRTTRLESVILGFINSMEELRALKQSLVRSNTRSVYKGDDDDRWIECHPAIQRIADTIEDRRLELGKTSGFEKMYHRVTKLYFGGMARHFSEIRSVLRPGARLAYVVGDQASYLRVMIRTGALLADIAQNLGYEVETIDLFRTRLATATKAQMREEVVVLRWPG